MPDHVIDTNVLLVASAADIGSPFDETHVPLEERARVYEWLAAYRKNGRALVLDECMRIYDEYRNKMTDQDYGLQVVVEKMRQSRVRQTVVTYDNDGTAIVSDDFAALDRSDRKFLATALADNNRSTIVNATDSDWFAIEKECTRHGIIVEQLLEDWLRDQKR